MQRFGNILRSRLTLTSLENIEKSILKLPKCDHHTFKPTSSLCLKHHGSNIEQRRSPFIQIKNKFINLVNKEPSPGTLISSDIADDDMDSHSLTRKGGKSDIQFPEIVAESPYENDYDNLYYEGVHYSELHITHCRAQWNNLIINTYDHTMKNVYYTTARLEGYKGAKKKSPVVNQQVGTIVARRLLKMGIKCTRVVLQGVGPGREAVVRGLFLGGLNIASLTDKTPVHDYYNMPVRPRKARRV